MSNATDAPQVCVVMEVTAAPEVVEALDVPEAPKAAEALKDTEDTPVLEASEAPDVPEAPQAQEAPRAVEAAETAKDPEIEIELADGSDMSCEDIVFMFVLTFLRMTLLGWSSLYNAFSSCHDMGAVKWAVHAVGLLTAIPLLFVALIVVPIWTVAARLCACAHQAQASFVSPGFTLRC
jgi:hypothetical protein